MIISDLSESLGRIVEAQFSCYFHIFFTSSTSRTLQNSHVEALWLWKNLSHGKIKNWKKSPWKRKKKKNRSKEERKSTILSRKEKNSFVKATSAGWAPRWRSDFKQRSRRQTKMCHTYTQFIFRFFHFCRGFCLRLWQLCSLLCRPPQRSTERSKKKKRCLQSGVHYLCIGNGSCCNGLLFPGNLDPSSLTPGGPVVSLVWGEIICWRGASCLRTFMS